MCKIGLNCNTVFKLHVDLLSFSKQFTWYILLTTAILQQEVLFLILCCNDLLCYIFLFAWSTAESNDNEKSASPPPPVPLVSREKFSTQIRHGLVPGMSGACVVPYEAFIREAFLFKRHLMGLWCVNVSLGAKGRRGESYVGLFYYIKTLISTVQCIGLFLLFEDDLHHVFYLRNLRRPQRSRRRKW